MQDDIKKVLAYSTISQLGYMVMGLGVGVWVGAVFHLFTHVFFKALLFLGAGSVSHSGSHHSFDMKKDMGGLRKYMPITFVTFVIGSLALAGIFPLAGFWSKDEILADRGADPASRGLHVVGLGGVWTPAAYMTRCVYLTFFGEYRGHGHPHESPKAITVPLIVLAGSARRRTRERHVRSASRSSTTTSSRGPRSPTTIFKPDFDVRPRRDLRRRGAITRIAVVGLATSGSAKELIRGSGVSPTATAWPRPVTVPRSTSTTWTISTTGAIVAGIKGPIARASYSVHMTVIDGVVNGVGRGHGRLGRLTYRYVDRDVVDGAVNGLARRRTRPGPAPTPAVGFTPALRAHCSLPPSGS